MSGRAETYAARAFQPFLITPSLTKKVYIGEKEIYIRKSSEKRQGRNNGERRVDKGSQANTIVQGGHG